MTVGIPAMILYNYYVNRVKGFIYQMETVGDEVLDILSRADKTEDEEAFTMPSKGVSSEESSLREPDPIDSEANIRYTNQSFDPEDLHSDGGKNP